MNDLLSLFGGTLIGFILISFVLFLLFREVWCWYFKINRAHQKLDLLQEQNKALFAELKEIKLELRELKPKADKPQPFSKETQAKVEALFKEKEDYRPAETKTQDLIAARRAQDLCLYCGQVGDNNEAAFCCEEHHEAYYQGDHLEVLA